MMILSNSSRGRAPPLVEWRAPQGQAHPRSKALLIDPLPFRRVPATPPGMVLAHLGETPLVRLTLLPFLQERIDEHCEIEADQKSPHGVSFWRTVACGNGPTNPARGGRKCHGSTNQQSRLPAISPSRSSTARTVIPDCGLRSRIHPTLAVSCRAVRPLVRYFRPLARDIAWCARKGHR